MRLIKLLIMKRILLLFFGMLLIVPGVDLAAQASVPGLIISEWAGINRYNNYVELTNVGDSALDLSDFTLACFNESHQFVNDGGFLKVNVGPEYQLRLSGILEPDSSFLLMNVFDGLMDNGLTYHRMEMLEIADEIVHYDNRLENLPTVVDPEREIWDFDSLSVHHFVMRLLGGLYGNLLFYHLPDGDSILIDEVKLSLNENLKLDYTPSDVAGIYRATASHILVRKANIVQGNPDWDNSRGVDNTDSEWIPIPAFPGRNIYTTVGTHGNFDIEISSSTIGINMNDSAMIVPWGLYKGESIIDEFTLGDGIGWQYIENTTSVADSAHVITQTGDILQIFACGNSFDQVNFKITTSDPASDMAKVFPLRKKYISDPVTLEYFWATPYYVTDGEPGMDTIGNVAFQTRVDTLLKYLEKAPEASYEVVWVDGNERVDLMNGDILKVTAEDNSTTKEYFIEVNDYAASSNATLSAITWPEKDEFLDGWVGDTIPAFSPSKSLYSITLPYGTVNVPALKAVTQNINAKIKQDRAVSLTGSQEQRTTVFTVTAEDDSTELQYKVTFELETPDANIQKFYGDPFISELVTAQWGVASYVEIVNPRNVSMDLSEYLFVNSASINPGDALASLVPAVPAESDFQYRYRAYVPGYKFYDDTATWLNNAGILVQDPSVNPLLDPGDVFVALTSALAREEWVRDRTPEVWAEIDKVWGTTTDATGTSIYHTFSCVKRNAEAVYVFKILNPDVLNGTKAIGDPLDYELVDVFGDALADEIWNVAGYPVAKVNYRTTIRRKENVYHGVTNIGDGMGTNAEDSDWIVEKFPEDFADQQDLNTYIGSHTLGIITAYLSTVSSSVFIVSDGYVTPQSIQGDLTGLTVNGLYGYIQKADDGQVLSMHSHADGSVLGADDPVAEDDTLVVVSADGMNETRYALINQPLSDDATLVVKAEHTSGITVSVNGNTGTISGSGLVWGSSLKDLMAKLTVPDHAVYSIIDQNENLVPLLMWNTMNELVETQVSDSIFIEVIAQNGLNIITYQLDPVPGLGDAFVVSDVYDVDQTERYISNIIEGTSVATLLSNVIPATGASLSIIDKAGYERSSGLVSFDDQLVVVSQDGNTIVKYLLNFVEELHPDVHNSAPAVTITGANNVVAGSSLTFSVSATDDGLPYGSSLTYFWELTAGNAASVTISSTDQISTDVHFSEVGTYEISVTVTDGELSTTVAHTIVVTAIPNDPPVVTITGDNTVMEGNTITLAATATDDGVPEGSLLTYLWEVTSGNTSDVTISASDQASTDVTFSAPGSFEISVTVSDSELSTKVAHAITVTAIPNQAPTVTISGENSVAEGESITLTATATDDGLPEGSSLTYLWEVTSGNASNVTISASDQAATDVSFNEVGEFEMTVTVSDGDLDASATHLISVITGIDKDELSFVNVYPNPAHSKLNIQFPETSMTDREIRLTNLLGKVVLLEKHSDSLVEINLDGMPEGLYILTIKTSTNTIYKKIEVLD
jgi:hypothetical protein